MWRLKVTLSDLKGEIETAKIIFNRWCDFYKKTDNDYYLKLMNVAAEDIVYLTGLLWDTEKQILRK